MIWNENNGPNPSSPTCSAAGGGSCNLAQQVATSGNCAGYSVTYYVGVPTSLSVWLFGYQPTACSQCYQSVASAVQIPSNCASSLAPTAQVCYIYNQCSGCGCFKAVWGSTAVCHSCNAGYYSQVPSFTACTACGLGTYSTGQGMLDTVEWPSGQYSFSSSLTKADCQMPKLDAEGGWCPQTLGTNEWIQLDLGGQQIVKGIVIQGRATAQEWATTVNLISSSDSQVWTAATNYGANADSYARKVILMVPFSARYLRLSPGAYNQWFSLRWNALVQVAVCATCSPGFYSASISSSVCTTCAQPLASNAFFSSNCNWLCNVGYYVAGSACSRCSDSSACLAGQYRPNCTDGLTDAQTCSGVCVNKAQSPQAIYLGPSTDNSNASCPWGCNAGYYKNLSLLCVSCQLTCGIGLYASTACAVPQNVATNGPTCLACTAVPNAAFLGSGLAGNATSCPFACVYGYFLVSQACVPWSPNCSKGYAWGAGNQTADRTCTPCQYVAQQTIYVYVQNSCNFTCGAGYQLINATLCQACPLGKFKASADSSLCILCSAGSYQPSTGMANCLALPANSVVANAQASDFVCNSGYYRVDTFTQHGCQACTGYPVLNAQSALWSNCSLVSLACNTGYYRNWTQLSCTACPPQPPSNATWGQVNASSPSCATCKNVSSLQDMLAACPFTCNIGFYSQAYACLRCATVMCTGGGLYAQLCTGVCLLFLSFKAFS